MQRNTKKRRTMASLEVSQLASAVDGDSATDVSFTRVRTVRGRRAALQQIVEMPMDVIYEICFHLQPKDLLNLARSSKNLRSIFMSRSMRHVWRATGRNVPGLPPCPRDLNEPSYASLLFDTSCSNCMRKNCGRVYWRCRVRLCNYCLRAQSVEKLEAWSMLSLDARALVGYPCFIDSYICPLGIRAHHNSETLYKPHVEAFIALMAETPIEQQEDVLKSAQENVTYLKESGASMEAWFDTWKENASIERVELRMGRLNAIRDKLDDLGWKAELDYLDLTFSRRKRFEKLPQIYKPKELTDQGWNVIRRAIINFMEDTKRDRLAYQAEILKDRLQRMPATVNDIVSNIPGLTLHTREVATCIPEVVKALDPSVVRFSDWFLQHNLRDWIPTYLEKRYRDARRSLANLLREYCSLHPSTDPFSLAVGSIFICARCNTARTLFYAVRHHCGTGQDDTLTRPDSCPEEYYLTVQSTFSSETSWHESLYKPGLERLVAVIKACGLDPKTATVEALDQTDVLLRLVREVSLTQTSMGIMNWRTAAFGTKLHYPEESKFETATGQQIAAARPLLFLSWWQSLWSSWNATEFCCAYCAEPTSTCEAVITHLRDCHNILVPTENDGVDLRITLPAAEPVYIIWKHDQAVSESFADPGLGTAYDHWQPE